MDSFPFFIFINNQSSASVYQPYSPADGLPFPLNVDFKTRLLVSLYLSLNLLFGSVLRSKILKYTMSLSIRENPINLFIWYDQLCGVFMALNIIFTLVLSYLPFPLASIIGEDACNWADLLSTLYVVSQAVWSSFIGIYRVLYIQCIGLFKKGSKQSKFVWTLSLTGYFYIMSSALFLAYHDRGRQYKLCTHYSIEEVNILMVSILFFNLI
jgi:hypothetical protein